MRCLLLALFAIPAALSQSVKSCGGPNDHLKNPVIKLTPDPPVKGGTLTIEASGTLDEAEESFNSNVDLSIKALGIVTATVKGGVPMSISPGAAAGPFSLTVGPFSLPGNVPGSAVVKGQIHVTNGKNEPIMCIDLDLDVPAAEEEVLVTPQLAQPLTTWTCRVCQHVYDPVNDGAGATFEDLPIDWVCPVCGSPKLAYARSVQEPVASQVVQPTLSTISSCGKATDHIPDFKIASSSGVITMAGTLDEAVTKASIDIDVSLKVLVLSLPLKMTIPLAVSDGLIKKGAIKSTVGPSTIAVSTDVKATVKGTMKINDGNNQEITCLNVDTVVASMDVVV